MLKQASECPSYPYVEMIDVTLQAVLALALVPKKSGTVVVRTVEAEGFPWPWKSDCYA